MNYYIVLTNWARKCYMESGIEYVTVTGKWQPRIESGIQTGREYEIELR